VGHPEPIGAADVTGAAAMFAADTASRAAGIELVCAGGGTAEVRMTVRPDMANGHGIVHGGYVFLLADTAFACACNESGSVTVASGADITFLAPARVGDVLAAVAAVRSRRGRSGVYDVTVTRTAASGPDADTRPDPGPEVIAEFRGRSRTLPPPRQEARQEGTAT
jgi:phenylacetic acid degradation protein PaaD